MARKKQNSSIMLPHGRKRTISPGFFTDPDVVSLDPLDRLLFIGIWCYADKAGRLLDKPIDLKMRLFPNDSFDVDAALDRIADCRLIHRYQVGRPRLRVLAMKEDRWDEIQRLNPNEPDSALPPPPSKSGRKALISESLKPPMAYAIVLDHQNRPSLPILSPGPSGPAGPSGSSGPSGGPTKKRSWHFELKAEMDTSRADRLVELELDPLPDEKLEAGYVLGAMERLRAFAGGSFEGVIALYDAYLSETWPAEKAPPYPFRVFASKNTYEQFKKKSEVAA